MRLLVRHSMSAYKADMLWLPKHFVNTHAVRARCSLYRTDGELQEAYWETSRHIVVPREFPLPDERPFEIVDYSPTSYSVTPWGCKAENRNEEDTRAWGSFCVAQGGILHLGCGKGKTVCGIRKIAYEEGPALVVVHTTQILEQWIEGAYKFLTYNGKPISKNEIGIVQGSRSEWDRPLVLAMIQTLDRKQIPSSIRRRFKVTIYDECHHLTAKRWMRLASFGYGLRYGLSATPEDEVASLHHLYIMHLGGIFYSDISQPLVPDTFFVHYNREVNLKDPDVLDVNNNLSLGRLYHKMGTMEERNRVILSIIEGAVANGRKLLVLSHSDDQCRTLHNKLVGSGLCVGGVPVSTRTSYLKNCACTFATMSLAKEGLDQPDLDVVFIVTPFSKRASLQQVYGRIQRPMGQPPIALIMEDTLVPPCASLCGVLRGHLSTWGFPHSRINQEEACLITSPQSNYSR